MKRPKNTEPPRDRLSELPDSLIFVIFWLLPMRDVVRTTLLSSRWRNLWATAPYLNFEEDCQKINLQHKVRNFINRALMLWRGTRIQKFAIDFCTLSNRLLYSDIDLWVRYAYEHEVEDLYLDLEYINDYIPKNGAGAIEGTRVKLYAAPQCLYSCSSLKKLYLKGCNLHIPKKNVNWNQLIHLRIDGYEINEDVMNKVLCGCPNLEVFILYLMENHKNLTIASRSLKNLFVDKYLYFVEDDVAVDTELVIEAPNLEMLHLVGIPYSKCSMKVPALIRANIWFNAQRYYSHKLFFGNDFVGETLKKILPAIQHVEEVELSDWCIKALGAIKNVYMLSPFPNVKVLKLNSSFGEYEEIVHLLEIFPELEILVLRQEKANKQFLRPGQDSLKFESEILSSFVQQLRRIMITWGECENSIFPLIEILLKHTSKLEKMVVRLKETSNPFMLFVASQKVQSMPRSSPTAELIFL